MEDQEFYVNQFVGKKGSPDKKFKIIGIQEDCGIVFYYLKEVLAGEIPDPSDRLIVVKLERLVNL